MKKTHLLLLVSVLVLLLGLLVACGKTDDPATEKVSLTMVVGDGTANTVQQIEKGKSYTLPEAQTRAGYVFAGWYGNGDFTGEPMTMVTPDADLTVYAKWNKLYELTLDPAGGTFATTKLSLAAGDVISEKIASLVPEKADCRFGTWLLDGEPLAADAVMGEEDVTLVAKYQIKYTIEVWKQNATRDGYDREAELIENYGYIGDAVTATYTVTGFRAVTKPDSVTQLVLAENAAANAFRLYFDRESRTLTFVSNYPDASENERTTRTVYYGVETELPFVTFSKAGYYLEGWSLKPDGEMVYYSHVMDADLFNAEKPAVEKITPEDNMTLYAVWSRGYTDLFGGADIMYVAKGEKNTVYLLRGGRYFKGRLNNGSTIAFFGNNVPSDFPVAQLNSDGVTFLYRNRRRPEITATLYEMGKGLNDLVTLTFDDANGVTYSEKDRESGVTTASRGTYLFDDDGYYVVTFTDGPLGGTTLTMAVGTVTVNQQQVTAFQVRKDEEVALGRIYQFVVDNNTLVVRADANGNPIGDLTMNGFGIAAYNSPSGMTSFIYIYDCDAETGTRTVTLISQGQTAGVLRLMELNGRLGYMIYNAATDVTYSLADGSTLKLDGIQTATYTGADGVAHTGFFTTATSAFGGTILTFTEGGVTYKFMLTVKTQDVLVDPENPDSGTTSTRVTVVEQLSAYYAEYYYKDADGTYYAPLFVFDTADRSTVTVYGRNPEKEYYKIAAGTLTYDSTTGLYLLTVTETFTLPEGVSPVFTEPVDFSKVKTCALMLNSTLTQYSVHFWFSYNDGVETVDNTTKYTGAGDSELTLVSGFAVYRVNGKTELGVYKQNGNAVVVSFADRNLYFTLDAEAGTFAVTEKTAKAYYEVGKDGSVSRTGYLVEDPVEGFVYYVVTANGETTTTAKYHGRQTRTGRTSLTGFPIYAFVSDAKAEGTDTPLYSFEYIVRDISTGSYFFRYDAAYAGTYRSTNTKDGVLKLDGFGLAATYTDGEGREYMCMYQKNGDQVLLTASSGNYYFLLTDDTCALRGGEYGRVYLMMDNQVFDGLYAEFDGLGHVTIFRMVQDGENYVREAVDADATYTVDGDRATITYTDGAAEHTITVKFGTITSGSNTLNALHTVHDEVVFSYVNEDDWSVLRLNGDGTATKYLATGGVETGTYSLVTEKLLYYVNTSGTQACIYVYDVERGTATPRSYDAVAYYTTELDSLLFSQFGFAIFNNSVRYYYTVDDNNVVTLYHLDETATDKNRYGYVEENFGEMADVKSYGDKTYYKNDGFAINFVRADATKDYYPVPMDAESSLPTLTLTFAPSGGENFSVSGTVGIGDETYNCTVVRETVDGVSKMYFTVYNFRFDITIHYEGDGVGSENKNTYEVTGLTNVNTMPSYTYLYYLYYIYQMMGSQYASQLQNSWGTITINTVYKQDGTVEERYMDAAFGESAKLMLSDGTLIDKLERVAVTPLASGVYQITFKAADEYQYTLILMARAMQAFRTYGFSIYALLREETVAANDGYVVTVNRVVASDIGYPIGSYYSFGLAKDGEEITPTNIIMSDGKLYYIVRGEGEGAKTYYYQLTLIEKSSGSLEEGAGTGEAAPGETTEEEDKPLPLYESATVTVIEATTARTADGKNCVDVLPENKILLVSLTEEADGKETTNVLLVSTCDYNAETGVYTLTTSAERTFTVTITEGVATITETTEPAAE